MAINKLITSEGNVQFIFGDTGKIINVHPFHIYTSFNEDTVSFILIAMPKTSGLAIFTSKAEDLEVNGEIYSFDDLPDALAEAFAIAGAQMRYEVVDELPETGQTNTIYLVPKQGGSGFDEYIYIRDTGEWELIGDTDIELARYLKKEDFNAYSAATKLKIDYISGATDYVSGAVDTEVARATSAETALQTAIDNETSARTEVDAILQTNIDNETSARTSADTALQTALDNEISARTSADTALQTAIDNETSARTEADATLQTNIDNEASARTEADNALQSAIDTVSGNVETETSRATSAETELQTAIDNEASARTSADSVISGAVDTLSSNKADKANAVASAVYVSSSTTIDLKNVSGEVISQVDASDFIVDGMVEDVRIENGYLIIDFNTASGIEDIEIPLTDIFNPSNYYDKDDINDIVSGINEDISDEVSARTEAISGLTDRIAEDEEVLGTALNQLNDSISAVNDSFSAYSTSAEVTAEINAAVSGKQDTLIAGENITISGNVISASGGGKAISAGTNISVTTGETADTISCTLPIYSQSSNLIFGGSNTNTLKSYVNSFYNSIFGEHNTIDKYGTNFNYKCAYNTIFGQYNKLFVDANNKDLNHSFIYGNNNTISSSTNNILASFALGSYNKGNNSKQALIGWNNNATNVVEMSFGQYNVSSSGSSTFGNSGNTLFSVGNGTAENARHNAFEIRQNGDIYITSGGTDIKLQDNLGSTVEVSSAITSGDTNAVAGGAVYDKFDEVEQVTARALIDLNESLSGKADTSALSGYVATSAVTSAVTSGSTSVVTSGGVYQQMGGLKLVKITQSAYDALSGNTDANTLYIITD